MRLVILPLLALVTASAGAQDSPIHLTCSGQARVTQRRTATAYSANSLGQSSTATVDMDDVTDSSEDIRIDLDGPSGEIRLPMFMLPPIHGGRNGVLPLRDIIYGRNKIIARTTLNFMNQPKIVLDRMTGAVSISGLREAFRGQCVPYDPAEARRAF